MNINDITDILIIAVISYFLGNINPAILIGKMKGIDIRSEGSGNAGMTNAMRVLGLGAGITVLVVDVLKGFIAVKIGMHFGTETGALVAFACVLLGHCYPALHRFKGGKGVAAGFGALLALSWQSALIALAAAAVLFIITRRMSVASMAGIIAFPVTMHFYMPDYTVFGVIIALFLLFMHRENIKRLFLGEELALQIRKKDHE